MNPRVLVAGIGNIFLGDDGFGVEVANHLAKGSLPSGVRVEDFGIRGLDLAYALLDEHAAVIFVDIAQRGQPPGTLYLIEPDIDESGIISIEGHGMDPVKVLALARSMGAPSAQTYLVACEPERLIAGEGDEIAVGLSPPVQAAVQEASRMVMELIEHVSATNSNDCPDAILGNYLLNGR